MNPEIVKQRRRRLVLAKIEALQERTGECVQLVKNADGVLVPVEITAEWLCSALACQFEPLVYAKYGYCRGDEVLANHYENCMGAVRMSPEGARFMKLFIEASVLAKDEDRLAAKRAIGMRGR